ncbi:hypothetical protein BC828DRAFT_99813 [Blastocladiella britannica]|nr:hypothetical protein BC828DRAFT_99813 [Blastocladiella britannica]
MCRPTDVIRGAASGPSTPVSGYLARRAHRLFGSSGSARLPAPADAASHGNIAGHVDASLFGAASAPWPSTRADGRSNIICRLSFRRQSPRLWVSWTRRKCYCKGAFGH